MQKTMKNLKNILHKFIKNRKGLSVAEIVIWVSVATIILGVVGFNMNGVISRTKVTAARREIETYKMALLQYNADNGFYPTSEQTLNALNDQPQSDPVPENWNGPYLAKKKNAKEDGNPLDPWRQEYQYICPTDDPNIPFEIISYGADGKSGGDGVGKDISSAD